MTQATHTADDERLIRQLAQTKGISVKEVASRLFYDLLMGLVPVGFEDRALQLYHAAETLGVAEGEHP